MPRARKVISFLAAYFPIQRKCNPAELPCRERFADRSRSRWRAVNVCIDTQLLRMRRVPLIRGLQADRADEYHGMAGTIPINHTTAHYNVFQREETYSFWPHSAHLSIRHQVPSRAVRSQSVRGYSSSKPGGPRKFLVPRLYNPAD